ncbi:MAG: hypothetical protein NVSMB63_09230 [Sediminibacterium sp.]
MIDIKIRGDPVGDIAMSDQVEVVKVDGLGDVCSFQTAQYHRAGTAAGTVFKNNLGLFDRPGFDMIQLIFRNEWNPVHLI